MDERGAVAENRPLLDPPAVSALDSDDSGSDVEVGDEVGAQMPVRVKCPNGTSFTVHIPPSCTVKEFKALITPRLEVKDRQRVRLMHGGRILSQPTEVLRDAGVEAEHCVHAMVAAAPRPLPPAASAPPRDEAGGEAGVEGLEGGRFTGFDRLREMGLGEDDVAAVRTMFAESVGELLQHVPQHEGEPQLEHFRRVEEVWMSRQGPRSEFALNLRARLGAAVESPEGHAMLGGMWRDDELEEPAMSQQTREGTTGEFVWGFLLGFTLGFFMLFWAAQRFVPRRQKYGIIAGVGMNMFLAATRASNTDSSGE